MPPCTFPACEAVIDDFHETYQWAEDRHAISRCSPISLSGTVHYRCLCRRNLITPAMIVRRAPLAAAAISCPSRDDVEASHDRDQRLEN